MYKTVTMLEYATIDEAWKRSPSVRYIPSRHDEVHEPIAQISNDMPQQMTGPIGFRVPPSRQQVRRSQGTDTVVNQQMIRIKINLHET
jgi:hypothetical protein